MGLIIKSIIGIFLLCIIFPIVQGLFQVSWKDEGRYTIDDEIEYEKARIIEAEMKRKKDIEDLNKLT
jgi:hypothetical protein